MTRSETKFQAPLNRRYQDVFGEKWTSNYKNYVNRSCEAWITFSDYITELNYWAFENKKKVTVAIPAPVSGCDAAKTSLSHIWRN